ncbi:MAG: IclR family transcriptional regulator [Acidimicrobiia bacterium]
MANDQPATKQKRRYPGGVNALRVLELLVDYPDGQGTTDIAEGLGMDAAQANRLLSGLLSAEYVAKTDTSPARYVITAKVLRLAARLLDQSDLLRVSRATMRRIRDQVGETVHLAAITGGEPVSVARELSRRSLSVMTRIGEVWPVNETAMGWVLQAFGGHIDPPERLLPRIARVKERGFAVDREEYVTGVVGITAPIFDYRGELVGALGLAGPVDRMPADELGIEDLGKLVADGALEISGHLGWIAQAPGGPRNETR